MWSETSTQLRAGLSDSSSELEMLLLAVTLGLLAT